MKPQLTQEQKLTWKMTQQLSQAIEILQYNGMELQEFIQQQMQDNPLIDWKRGELPMSGEAFPASGVRQTEQSLREYMYDQMMDIPIEARVRRALEYGVDSLDDNGYLDCDVKEWKDVLQEEEWVVESALSILQTLEPAGVGARDLQECITLQLLRKQEDEQIIHLVQHHLDWVAEQQLPSMMECYGWNEEEVHKAVEVIQACHPRPGLQIAPVQKDYIIPDARVVQREGVWRVELSPLNQPVIQVDQTYAELVTDDEEARMYVQEKYKHAEWLQMAIRQRKEHFHAIVREIIDKQKPFLHNGAVHVQALRMREIATKVDIHVSTVSRAIRNKYVQTPHGIYPLKFFFQQGIKMNNGQETSAHSIKHLLKETIELENVHKPLSDQKIVEKLKSEFGIAISRRTVAKYREELFIPSSSKRKRQGGTAS